MSLSQAIKFIHTDRKDLYISLYSTCSDANSYVNILKIQEKYILKKTKILTAFDILKTQLTIKELKCLDALYIFNLPPNKEIAKVVGLSERSVFRIKSRLETKFQKIFDSLPKLWGKYTKGANQ